MLIAQEGLEIGDVVGGECGYVEVERVAVAHSAIGLVAA